MATEEDKQVAAAVEAKAQDTMEMVEGEQEGEVHLETREAEAMEKAEVAETAPAG